MEPAAAMGTFLRTWRSEWAGLSRACHQHPYELPPTSSELLGWLATVEALVARVKG